eukprot:scaffold42280_cov18-Tisochrysis_lutea.AAC.1
MHTPAAPPRMPCGEPLIVPAQAGMRDGEHQTPACQLVFTLHAQVGMPKDERRTPAFRQLVSSAFTEGFSVITLHGQARMLNTSTWPNPSLCAPLLPSSWCSPPPWTTRSLPLPRAATLSGARQIGHAPTAPTAAAAAAADY